MQKFIKSKQLHGKRCHGYVIGRQIVETCVNENISSKRLNADRSSEYSIGVKHVCKGVMHM